MLQNSMILDVNIVVIYDLQKNLKKYGKDLQNLQIRKRNVRCGTFTLNIFSEAQRLTDFDLRFPKIEAYRFGTPHSSLSQT